MRAGLTRAGVASAAVALGLAFITPVLAAPAGALAPSDIQSTFFTGQSFTASTNSSVKYKMTFTADGKMKREPTTGGTKGEGTWKLSKDGFCTTWTGAKASCFTLVSAGDNKWSVMKGSTVIATWSK
jgi:hypothetical protein